MLLRKHVGQTLGAFRNTRYYATTRHAVYDKLECDIIEPKIKHKSTIIFCHGLGDSSNGFKELMRDIVPPSTRCLLPNAPMRPITLNGGYVMRGWYDIKTLDRMGDAKHLEDKQGILESKELLSQLLDIEHEKLEGKNSVILGGFSQGLYSMYI